MATKISPPLTGYWNLHDFPDLVWLGGSIFRKAVWRQAYSGVIEQYREDIATNSRHLMVLADCTWRIDHIDTHNPDQGRAAEHFFDDHPLGPVVAFFLGFATCWAVGRAITRT